MNPTQETQRQLLQTATQARDLLQQKLNQKQAKRETPETPTPPTPPPISGIESPAPAPTPTVTPELPEPTAPQKEEAFVTSLTEQAKNTRATVEEAYKNQLADIDKKTEKSQKEVDRLTEQQEALIETDIQPLLTPFREDLENSERQRLYVNQNFEANQKLVGELESLLTEGNNLIKQAQGAPMALSVLNKSVHKTMADVNARAGVIQAVMNARSGQIGEAYRMIDRTTDAITADRKDQLDYYSTVFDFYENQKDEEGKKILNLEKDQKEFISAQIGLLEKDMVRAEENAENLKQAMQDPDTALLYAEAGVTLNDTQEQIATKVADAVYQKELRDISNEMAMDGFTALAPGQSAPPGTSVQTITDSKGNTKSYYKKDSKGGGSGGTEFKFTPTKRSNLIGQGFSTVEVDLIEQSINENGIKATLLAIDDENQRLAVAESMNALNVLSEIEQGQATPDETITSIVDNATDEQIKSLKKVADNAGVSGFWSGKKTDVRNLLEMPEMKAVIENALNQGLDMDGIIDALTTSSGEGGSSF